jgi:hypothetical protein
VRVYLDSEFIEDGRTIELISIGLVREDGKEYYAQNAECDFRNAGVWVKGNVIPLLQDCADHVPPTICAMSHRDCVWRFRKQIASDIVEFVGEKPEFWGYFADYDWVVLCQLYGKMVDLPKGWPMFAFDIKMLSELLGNERLPKQINGEHHALMDARWVRDSYLFLEKLW